jgi:hypothetical protein
MPLVVLPVDDQGVVVGAYLMACDDEEEGADEPTQEDLIDAALDYESQQRLWLRAIGELIAKRSVKTDPSDRVQFALDMLMIAACERGARILGSDLPR